MTQITVISGPERRRVWTDQQKRELVAAVSAPGANVAEIVRRADLRPNQIYRWRRQMGQAVIPVRASSSPSEPYSGSGMPKPVCPKLIPTGDGADAPRRHRCAKVEVLNTT